MLWILVLATVFGCGGGDGGGNASKNNPPTAAVSLSGDTGTAPLSVAFDGSGSQDSDGYITSYSWSFGDGTTGSGSQLQHVYENAGAYKAELTVTDDDGATDTASVEITVSEPVNSAPAASFTLSSTAGAAPLSVTLNASVSWDSDGAIVSYVWNFGDGATGRGISVQHTYTTAGSYTVSLTVTDDDGLTDTASRSITVVAAGSRSFTISGTVTSAENVATDSDVNDISTQPVSNNSFARAQVVVAPVTISGYVNVARNGYWGTSYDWGDLNDYYQVILTEGMNIFLYMVEDPRYSELNLYLYDSDQILKDATATDSQVGVASLTVPADGSYYVRVEAVSDFFINTATVYSLTLGLSTSTSNVSQYPLRLSDDFVPGEVLVRFESESGAVVSMFSGGSSGVSLMGFQTQGGTGSRDKLLRRSDAIDSNTFFETLGIQSAVESSLTAGAMDSETRAKMETLWMVRGMRRQSGVFMAEPNYIRKPLMVPNDAYYAYQWHYPLINLPEAWDIYDGAGGDVVVAVVDTGVLLDHPDLSGQLLDGYDFISDPDISLDGDGIDDDPDDPGDQADISGSSFHGTHVAGIIAALTNNDDGESGIAGTAFNAKILPVRALGFEGGTTYDIMEAVKYAAGLENDSGIILDTPADIINLSLGGDTATQYEESIYEEVREKGVIVVAAAGNNASSAPTYPAAYDGVVSVSGVTISETLGSYSNYGDTIDVAAPGGSSTDTNGDGYMDGVLSTIGDDSGGDIEMGYAFSIGTSMAVPHVAGVIAIMKSLYPGMTPDEFDALLVAGYLTQDLGDSGWDEKFGWGLIDAYKSALVAREGGKSGGIPAILSVSPGRLRFGVTLGSADVTVENSGGEGELVITDYYSDAPWISVSPSDNVDQSGLGVYTVSVNRGGLSDGSYSGTITFVSGSQSAEVIVIMRVAETTGATDGGYHYILLLDPDTYDTIDQVGRAGESGVYEYSFPGLYRGASYMIYAGTDPNNDNLICDDGEACGAFISLDEPAILTVEGDMDGIDFSTDINITLPTITSSRFGRSAWPLQREVLKEVAE